jgi:hypothetical protein
MRTGVIKYVADSRLDLSIFSIRCGSARSASIWLRVNQNGNDEKGQEPPRRP